MFTDLRIPAGRRPMTDNEARIAAAIGLAISLLFLVAIFEEYSARKLSIFFFILFWVPMLVLHEFGHALAAHLVGWRVREIVIGFGRTLWQWQIGATRIRVKLAPLEGYVLPAPADGSRVRSKSALIYAAGPGAEFLLLLILVLLFGWDTVFNQSNEVGLIALKSLAVVIIVGGGFNLLPFRTEGAVSDGLGILCSPFLSDEAVEMRLLTFDVRAIEKQIETGEATAALTAIERLRDRYPDNLWLQIKQAETLSLAGRSDDARRLVREQLRADDLPDNIRREWLKCQADIELNTSDPDYLVLDLAMQAAFRITPDAGDLTALRGASFVLRHRTEEGGNMLAEAWRKNDPAADDSMMLAYLAIAAHRAGNSQAAAHFRESFEAVNRRARLQQLVDKLT